jgi:hypothetical protein
MVNQTRIPEARNLAYDVPKIRVIHDRRRFISMASKHGLQRCGLAVFFRITVVIVTPQLLEIDRLELETYTS